MEKLIVPSILISSEVVTLSENLIKITKPLTQNDVRISDLHTSMTTVAEHFSIIPETTTQIPIGEQLRLIVKRLNEAFISLHDILHSMTITLPDLLCQKAEKLYAIINKFCPEAYQLGFKAEPKVVSSLIRELDLEPNLQFFIDLNILHFYDPIKSAMKEFEWANRQATEIEHRIKSNAEMGTADLEVLCQPLISLVAIIQLYYQLDPPKYGVIYNQMINYIDEVNALAMKRQSGNKKRDIISETPASEQGH